MNIPQSNDQPIIPSNIPQNDDQPLMQNDLLPNNEQMIIAIDNSQNIHINDNNINNNGYFYIEPNDFMILENQQKISFRNIERKTGILKKFIIVLSFFIFFILSGFLTAVISFIGFPGIIIAFIGFCCSSIYAFGPYNSCNEGFINYNSANKNIEIKTNFMKDTYIRLDNIDKIIMEDNAEGSIFYFISKSGAKNEFLKMPLVRGVPFKKGEVILNDFINFWKKKEGYII